MKVLKDLLTGIDGETHDLGRWMGVISFLSGMGLEVYVVVWKSQTFSFLEFGGGIAALATGIGAMLKLKESMEPK